MEPTIHGLQEIQALISSCLPWALLRLWQHQLIWRRADEQWALTATGATLRPILQAIQTCTDQKGGTNS